VQPFGDSSKVKGFFFGSAVKLFCLAALLAIATIGFAAPTVTVLSPKSSSNSGSPVFYEAYATSSSCSKGVSAMRVYTAPGVSAYTVNGAHIETFVTLKSGSYSTVVQAWDKCGGVAKTTVDITVNSNAGVSVFLPKSSSADIPVHIAASAQNPDCSAGIRAIRIYTADGITPYTIDSNQLNAFVNLLPGTYDFNVQAWDNCGHVYKAPLAETAVGAADGYLYALTTKNSSNYIAEFSVSNGVLKNPNGSGNPPLFPIALGADPIAIDPGGWFVYVGTFTGIYGFQIDQSTGNLAAMPGSPFSVDGWSPSDVAVDPNGNFLLVAATSSSSNAVQVFQINRSSGALTEAANVADSAIYAVTADFTGQYVYGLTQDENSTIIWGYAIDQNNGTLRPIAGSPYTIPNASYGRGLSATMLSSGSPASPLLYAQSVFSGFPLMGYAVNYGTGALTAVPGSPFAFDQTLALLADNQGKWIWSATTGARFDVAAIGSNGTLGPTQEVKDRFYNSALAEDGTGRYLYAGGSTGDDCLSGSGTVTSWTVSDGNPVLLSGPLESGLGPCAGPIAAASKHGD
jgi:Lactonase, 7-bladed beta-propeller